MTLYSTIENSKGKFLVRTVPTSMNIEFGTGFETQVHPFVDGVPYKNEVLDYKHSDNKQKAKEAHQLLVDKHSEL